MYYFTLVCKCSKTCNGHRKIKLSRMLYNCKLAQNSLKVTNLHCWTKMTSSGTLFQKPLVCSWVLAFAPS